MCGIICEICHSSCSLITDKEIKQKIQNRGPDAVQATKIEVNGTHVSFFGAVLWMQGPQPTLQPIENEKGILLYNGDIFDDKWNSVRSDTEQIMERFSAALIGSPEDLIKELKCFKGPFSIIFYNKLTSELLITRDKIGRNSLLLHKNNKNIVISSVLGRKYDCVEIPATHFYMLNLLTNKIKLYSWNDEDSCHDLEIDEWIKCIQLQQSLPDEEFSVNITDLEDLSDKDGIIHFIETISMKSTSKSYFFQNLLNNLVIKNVVLTMIDKLDNSVKIRLKRQPKKCKDCLYKSVHCIHSAVGILFSGGLDCTVLAYLANRYVAETQSIDLLNVAFKKDDGVSYEVPDRLTGRQSLEELKKICPQRRWVFKEINVPREKLVQQQEAVIADLVYPRQTILDESLGSALWFAAQGQVEKTESPCRVLLLGSGADELFGGYTRHRNAFKRYGWTGLSKELLLDWKRISFRNLARDNRVLCDHGRQPRMPYLDENFSDFVLNLKPWFKCFPSEYMGPGVGDKLFLRLVAFHLGLEGASVLPKRALQFGSRIANKKEKGSDVSRTFLKS